MNWHTTLLEKMKNIKKWKSSKTWQALCQERGGIFVLTAILLPLMFGFIGLAYDVGNLYMHKARLQNVADAAALAGAREFLNHGEVPDTTDGSLPSSQSLSLTEEMAGNQSLLPNRTSSRHENADKAADKYIVNNLANLQNEVTTDGNSHVAVQVTQKNEENNKYAFKKYYRVGLSENVRLSFLPILPGINRDATVRVGAVALAQAEADGTSNNTPTPPLPVLTGFSYSVFDNLFTFSDFMMLDKLNHNDERHASFDGRIVYTMLNNNTETSSSGQFFYDLGEKAGDNSTKPENYRHVYSEKGKKGWGTAHINDPFANPYLSTRDYIDAFKQWLRTDEAGNKLYYEVTGSNSITGFDGNNFTESTINQNGEHNVFHIKSLASGNLDINTGYINTTSKYNVYTPVYIIVEDTIRIQLHLRNTNRPVVIVYLGNQEIRLETGNDAKMVIYAPDAKVFIGNYQGNMYGNIIAKIISTQGSHNGSWYQRNFLENENYTDPFIKARTEQIQANILANGGADESTYTALITAMKAELAKNQNFDKNLYKKFDSVEQLQVLLGYFLGKHEMQGNEFERWYIDKGFTDEQKRIFVDALARVLYGDDWNKGTGYNGGGSSGGSGGGSGESGGNSQPSEPAATSFKIRLIADSEIKNTPFSSLQ